MPFSKNIAKYPAEFLLLPAIPDSSLPRIITLNNPREAHALRMRIYAFTEALRANNHPDANRMDALLFRVQGPLLIIELRDLQYGDIFKEIKEVVDNVPMPALEPKPIAPYKSEHEAHMQSFFGKPKIKADTPCARFAIGLDGDNCYNCLHPRSSHTVTEASSPPTTPTPITTSDEKK